MQDCLGESWWEQGKRGFLCVGLYKKNKPALVLRIPISPTAFCNFFLPVWCYLLHNVCKSREQRLTLVLNAVFGTQGLHQRSHLPVVVSWHCGE